MRVVCPRCAKNRRTSYHQDFTWISCVAETEPSDEEGERKKIVIYVIWIQIKLTAMRR